MKIKLMDESKLILETEIPQNEDTLPQVIQKEAVCYLIQNVDRAGEPVAVYQRVNSQEI